MFCECFGLSVGVTVLVFKDGCDPATLGPHLHEELEQGCVEAVLVALVNDSNCLVAVESRLPGLGVPLGPVLKVSWPHSGPRQKHTHREQC